MHLHEVRSCFRSHGLAKLAAGFSCFLTVKLQVSHLIFVSTHRSPQANSMPFKDSAPCPSDLKQLFLPGQGASRPLPTLSRTSQSTAATGQAACSPPPPPFAANTEQQEPPDYKDTPREIPPRFDGNRNECRLRNSLPASPSHSSSSVEKEESELHLYVISETSSIFLHLKSSWNNYIIVSTLTR